MPARWGLIFYNILFWHFEPVQDWYSLMTRKAGLFNC